MNLFVTATDTGAGKTYVTCLLVRALRRAGLDACAMKPICCGDRRDAELLRDAAGNAESLDTVNPVWFRAPLAPLAAGLAEERLADVGLILDTFRTLRARHPSLLIEGVGGWMVPIRRDYFVADLAADLGFPVAVVVNNRLGALNHAALTLHSIRRSGLECAGLILNHPEGESAAAASNRAVIEELLRTPILFDIARDQPSLDLAVA